MIPYSRKQYQNQRSRTAQVGNSGNEYFCNANRKIFTSLNLKTELHVTQSVFVIIDNYPEHV